MQQFHRLKRSLGSLFGEIIRAHREAKGWSQMKLAAEANLHLTALGSIERGRRNPSLLTVYLIANALEIPPEVIIAEVSAKKPNLKDSNGYLDAPKHKPGRPKK
ncbi:MAG: XRE family transcriptional regulator [Puniceicoccaceae bacterium]|nr:MAG: XRE family transcriptional regulator [Puniceicoccaceae bacterium]